MFNFGEGILNQTWFISVWCCNSCGLNFIFSYNKQYEHSIYVTDISINIIQKESRRKSKDLFESASLYLQ